MIIRLGQACIFIFLFVSTVFSKSLDLNFETHELGNFSKLSAGDDFTIDFDMENKSSGKKSIKLTRVKGQGGSSFTTLLFALPTSYIGNSVSIEGDIKTENVESGYAGLWIRLEDGKGGILGFNNMRNEAVTGTTDWKKYKIELVLYEQVEKIYFGGLFSGDGQVWFDNLSLKIDGKSYKLSKKKPKAKGYVADNDFRFSNGTQYSLDKDLNHEMIEKLTVLGKVWGFVKYHSNEVAAGKYNWDAELLAVLPKLLESSDFYDDLYQWVASYGSYQPCTIQCQISYDKMKLVLKPNYNWLEGLGEEHLNLKLLLIDIFKKRDFNQHYYIEMSQHVGNPKINNEREYRELDSKDDGLKLIALYRYWNIVNYFYPYIDILDKDWSEVLKDAIPDFIDGDTPLSYRLSLLKIIGAIGDTHANIWGMDEVLEESLGKMNVPIKFKYVADQFVALNDYQSLKRGDLLLEVGDESVKQWIEKNKVYFPSSNSSVFYRDIASSILRTNNNTVDVVVMRAKERLKLTLETKSQYEAHTIIQKLQDDTPYKLIDSDVGYISIGEILKEDIDKAFDMFMGTKGLIIDIRHYPKDFPIYHISNKLFNSENEFVKFTSGDIKNPGTFTFTEPLTAGSHNGESYQGTLIILIDESTQSSAEFHSMAFRSSGDAIVIGSQTAGSDGNVSRFRLPGGIRTAITGIGVFYPDGTVTQRIGIIPDIELRPSVKGIMEGRDELLDKALEVIRNE